MWPYKTLIKSSRSTARVPMRLERFQFQFARKRMESSQWSATVNCLIHLTNLIEKEDANWILLSSWF